MYGGGGGVAAYIQDVNWATYLGGIYSGDLYTGSVLTGFYGIRFVQQHNK